MTKKLTKSQTDLLLQLTEADSYLYYSMMSANVHLQQNGKSKFGAINYKTFTILRRDGYLEDSDYKSQFMGRDYYIISGKGRAAIAELKALVEMEEVH